MKTNKIFIGLIVVFMSLGAASCQNSNKLEYGDPLDLSKINWRKQNLDSLFSELAYIKEIDFKKTDVVYKGKEPLRIPRKIHFNDERENIDDRKDFYKIVKPGEHKLEPSKINRLTYFSKNQILRNNGAFGFYIDDDILFTDISTVSTGNDNLGMIEFGSDSKYYSELNEDIYYKLRDILSKRHKDMKLEVNPHNEYPYYTWKSEHKKIKIIFSTATITNKKGEKRVIYNMFLRIIFYNKETAEVVDRFY